MHGVERPSPDASALRAANLTVAERFRRLVYVRPGNATRRARRPASCVRLVTYVGYQVPPLQPPPLAAQVRVTGGLLPVFFVITKLRPLFECAVTV